MAVANLGFSFSAGDVIQKTCLVFINMLLMGFGAACVVLSVYQLKLLPKSFSEIASRYSTETANGSSPSPPSSIRGTELNRIHASSMIGSYEDISNSIPNQESSVTLPTLVTPTFDVSSTTRQFLSTSTEPSFTVFQSFSSTVDAKSSIAAVSSARTTRLSVASVSFPVTTTQSSTIVTDPSASITTSATNDATLASLLTTQTTLVTTSPATLVTSPTTPATAPTTLVTTSPATLVTSPTTPAIAPTTLFKTSPATLVTSPTTTATAPTTLVTTSPTTPATATTTLVTRSTATLVTSPTTPATTPTTLVTTFPTTPATATTTLVTKSPATLVTSPTTPATAPTTLVTSPTTPATATTTSVTRSPATLVTSPTTPATTPTTLVTASPTTLVTTSPATLITSPTTPAIAPTTSVASSTTPATLAFDTQPATPVALSAATIRESLTSKLPLSTTVMPKTSRGRVIVLFNLSSSGKPKTSEVTSVPPILNEVSQTRLADRVRRLATDAPEVRKNEAADKVLPYFEDIYSIIVGSLYVCMTCGLVVLLSALIGVCGGLCRVSLCLKCGVIGTVLVMLIELISTAFIFVAHDKLVTNKSKSNLQHMLQYLCDEVNFCINPMIMVIVGSFTAVSLIFQVGSITLSCKLIQDTQENNDEFRGPVYPYPMENPRRDRRNRYPMQPMSTFPMNQPPIHTAYSNPMVPYGHCVPGMPLQSMMPAMMMPPQFVTCPMPSQSRPVINIIS